MVNKIRYIFKSEPVRWIERGVGVIVLNPKARSYHKLNESASFVWQRCNGMRSIGDIAMAFKNAYRVNACKAEEDIHDIITNFKNKGLVVLRKNKETLGSSSC